MAEHRAAVAFPAPAGYTPPPSQYSRAPGASWGVRAEADEEAVEKPAALLVLERDDGPEAATQSTVPERAQGWEPAWQEEEGSGAAGDPEDFAWWEDEIPPGVQTLPPPPVRARFDFDDLIRASNEQVAQEQKSARARTVSQHSASTLLEPVNYGRRNALARAALVSSLLGIPSAGLGFILGVVLGHWAHRQQRTRGYTRWSRKDELRVDVALWFGYGGLLGLVLGVGVFIMFSSGLVAPWSESGGVFP